MTISHDEFRRILQLAFPATASSAGDNDTEFRFEGDRVRVRLSPQGSRRIGTLQLPVTKVLLEFDDMAEADIQRFIDRFNRSFQRGGG